MEEIIEKLRRIFTQRFPGCIAELEPTVFAERIGGSLIWSGFEDLEQIDRQKQVSRAVRNNLSPEELKKVAAILTFTPNEIALMHEDEVIIDEAGREGRESECAGGFSRERAAAAAPARDRELEDLAEKLKQVLLNRLVGSVLELDRVDLGERMSGTLIWSGFEAVEQLDRQRQVGRVLRKALTPKERQRVSIIFTLTPEEVAAMRDGR